MLRHGLMPWWDPFYNGGQPLLASPNTLALHPIVLLYLLAAPSVALGLSVAACAALSMVAVDRLASRLGLGRSEGLLAALVFGTSGIVASCVNLQPLFLALCAVPPLLVFLDSHLESGSPRALAFAVLCGGWIAFAGTLEAAIVAAITGVTWTLVVPGDATTRRRLGALVLLGLGVIALAAVLAIPAFHVLHGSRRAAGLGADWILNWSVDPRRLPELFIPGFTGRIDALDSLDRWSSSIELPSFPYMLSLHLGALPILLALAGACGRGESLAPRRLRIALAALALVAGGLALGRHLPGATSITLALPVRYPVKALCAALLPVALLAGLGLREVRLRTPAGLTTAALAGGLAGVFAAASVACLLHGPATTRAITWWFRMEAPKAGPALAVGLAIAAAQAGMTALLPTFLRHRFGGIPALTLVAATGLMVFWAVNPAADAALLRGEPPAVAVAREAIHGGRIHSDADDEILRVRAPTNDSVYETRGQLASLSGITPARYGLPVILHADFDGLVPLGLARLTDAALRAAWPERTRLLAVSGASLVSTLTPLNEPGLEPLTEIEIGASVPMRLYRVSAAIPTIRFVSRSVPARDTAEALALLVRAGAEPSREVVLTDDRHTTRGQRSQECVAAVSPPGLGELPDWQGEVDAKCDGFVVIALPPHAGSTVTVDGRMAPLLVADAAFIAVEVPKGRHVLQWRYRPPGFVVGAILSLTALVSIALAILHPSGRRKEPERLLPRASA